MPRPHRQTLGARPTACWLESVVVVVGGGVRPSRELGCEWDLVLGNESANETCVVQTVSVISCCLFVAATITRVRNCALWLAGGAGEQASAQR